LKKTLLNMYVALSGLYPSDETDSAIDMDDGATETGLMSKSNSDVVTSRSCSSYAAEWH